MMLFEAFSPFPALAYFSGRTSRERSCPIRGVPSRLGFWAPSSQPLLPPDCRPSSETCLIHKFGLRGVPKQLDVSHPDRDGDSSCHRRWPSLGPHVSPPVPPGPVPVWHRSFSLGSKPLSCGARQQESGFAGVVVCAELQTPFIQLLMMGAEAFACPLVPPSGKCNTYFFLKASSVSAKCTDKGKQKVSQSSPKCLCCNCCSPQGRGCVCGLGGSPGAGSPGAGPAVSDDLMQKYCFMPQKVNYASFTHFCLLLLPPSSLLL